MNLKTLMRYDAYLREKIGEADQQLRNFATKSTAIHKIQGQEPEIITTDMGVYSDVTGLLVFRMGLATDRQHIAEVVEKHKGELDALVAKNIVIRDAISILDQMMGVRLYTKQAGWGTVYGLNVAGDSVPIKYPVETSSELAYDLAIARDYKRELMKEAEKNSEEIEKIKASEVQYVPLYAFGMSLEEMYLQK